MSLVKKIGKRLRWELSMRFGMFTDAGLINHAVAQRVGAGQRVLLNLGCGLSFHGDWVNVDFRGNGLDVASWDLRTPIPLPDGRCDAIYASHMIEHFTRDQARCLLVECRRLLKAGGCVRLATPDLEGIVQTYIHALRDARAGEAGGAARHDWMTIEMIDQLVRHQSGGEMAKYWARAEVPEEAFVIQRVGSEYLRAREHLRGRHIGSARSAKPAQVGKFRLGGEPHLWMYDDYALCQLLKDCGFQNAYRTDARTSAIDNFASFSLDADESGVIRKPDSFFVEGLAV